jgi:integrase
VPLGSGAFPRARKKRRAIRVLTFEELHRFAKAAVQYEPMVRVFSDCGLRLGEVLPLRREDFDGETLKVRRTAHEGIVLEGTKPATARKRRPNCSDSRDPRLDARSTDQA